MFFTSLLYSTLSTANSHSRIVTFVTFVVLHVCLSAQNVVLREMPTYRQMPIAHMHHVVEDKDGFMWYATEGGLCRDNGYQVDMFRNDIDNIDYWGSNHVREMAIGKDGKIWVITESGLYRIDPSDYSLRHVKVEGMPSSHNVSVSVTSDGNVWVIVSDAIYRLSAEGKLQRTYKAKNKGDGFKFINAIFEDSRHNVWLSECRGSLMKYDRMKDKFTRCDWPEDCEPHGGIHEDKANRCLWVATWGRGIVRYTPDETGLRGQTVFQPCTYIGNTLNSNKGKIVSMCASKDGKVLWCSAMDGFYAYDIHEDGTLTERDLSGLLPKGKNVFATNFRDSHGNIWVCSYSPHPFILVGKDNGIERHAVDAVARETGMETIVESIAFENGYVWMWHLRLNMMLHNPANGDNNLVLKRQNTDLGSSVMTARDGGIWSSYGNTVCEMAHDGMTVTSRDVTTVSDNVTSLYDDGNGRLWIGTSTSVWCHDLSTGKTRLMYKDTGKVTKMRMSFRNKSLYFVSQQYGLAEGSDNGKVRPLSKGLKERISSFDISEEGKLYVSTDLGSVYRLDERNGTLVRDDMMSLQSSDEILDVAFDSLSHLWLLTTQFVKECDLDRRTSRIIRADDDNITFDYFLTLEKAGDRMCVGGAGGYCLIRPSTGDNVSDTPPRVTSIVIDGRKTLVGRMTKMVTVEPEDMNVEINFSTLDHLRAGDIRFAYCLRTKNSSERKWIYLPQGHNTAYFAGMRKGDYVLEVKATDRYGNWGEPSECLTIKRLPAWWDTWYMFLLYIALAAGVSFLLVRMFYRDKMQNMEIRKLVNLAKEMRESMELREKQEMRMNEEDETVTARTEEEDTTGEHMTDGDTEEETEDNAPELSKAEHKFLLTAKSKVEENISNSNYTTEMLASDMCMSRMNLYRKLNKVTGQKPSEFIRMVRLQAAAKMLSEGEFSVAEIAEKVGFSNPSYFSKCFKDAFGVIPKRYR